MSEIKVLSTSSPFSAGLATAPSDAEAGKALIAYLAAPAAAVVLRTKGMEAG